MMNEPINIPKEVFMPNRIVFNDVNGKLVGTLFLEDPLRFEGNADQSARLFIDNVIGHWNGDEKR